MSKRTIQRCLNKKELHGYNERGFWDRVLCSDEMKIELLGHNNVKKDYARERQGFPVEEHCANS